MKKVKVAAQVTINQILYIIYRICRAFIIWYMEDEQI